jgi:hypothetical protein
VLPFFASLVLVVWITIDDGAGLRTGFVVKKGERGNVTLTV